MKVTNIITPTQKNILDIFSQNNYLTDNFVLSGCTALAGFYLPYRFSEDLDFFSIEEVNILDVTTFLKSLKPQINYTKFDINTSFNRNLVYLHFPSEVVKLEFTYYPFPPVEKPNRYQNIKVDTILDIAVNKLFTIYQKPRSRDFIYLYMIQKKYHYKITDLIKKAKLKFDWHVDNLKLGSQFILCTTLLDYPNLVKPIDPLVWQKYFLDEAKNLKRTVLK